MKCIIRRKIIDPSHRETRQESLDRVIGVVGFHVRREDWYSVLSALRFHGNGPDLLRRACWRVGYNSQWVFEQIVLAIQRRWNP